MYKYGENISGYDFNVVNEKEVRAAAGIMFAIGIVTFMTVLLTRDYGLLYYVVPLFWLDFFLKSVFDPKYSIFGFIGKAFVKSQKPEYVGAIQKRFAWSLGLVLASVMLIFSLFMGVRGVLPLSVCITCLTFMWMESSLGICVGCKIYKFLLDNQIIREPAVRPTCPGGACSVSEFQKVHNNYSE
ncbi:DUF4395 family protein [Candidatus Peregrinibacteria bacterium]|nr:DUF4395 family protein [Candidatus Peregrinibacteria bacterium]